MILKEHRGFQIGITDQFTFKIEPLADDNDAPVWAQSYDSFDAAKKAIDEHFQVAEQQERASATIHVHMLDSEGNNIVVRGINGAYGRLMATPALPKAGAYSDYVYPAHPTIKSLLQERVKLRKRLNEIDQTFRPVAVDVRRVYGRAKASEYPKLIASLNDDITKATDYTRKKFGAVD